MNDRARSIKLFEYFIEFLKIFGQENYGESAEVDWYAVYNYCQSYHMLDFNAELEEIIYADNDEEFRDKCFEFMERNIIEGYPVWQLFKMSDWLTKQLNKELHDREEAKDKEYFYKLTKCYRCQYYSEHISAIDKMTGYSYPAQDHNDDVMKQYLNGRYNLLHTRICGKRKEIIHKAELKAMEEGRSTLRIEQFVEFEYDKFNEERLSRTKWSVNPWTLRDCPYFCEDPIMDYEHFIRKYLELTRFDSDSN